MFSLLTYPFIQRTIISGVLLGTVCAILGLFLVLRKMSLIGDGLSHMSFGAIAIALALGIFPLWLAIPSSVIASIILYTLTRRKTVQGDSIIGILSALGLATGIIIISLNNRIPIDINSYLFGNLLAIGQSQIWMIGSLFFIVLMAITLYYYEFFAIAFDYEQAKVSGVRVIIIDTLFAILTGLTIIFTIQLVGTLLVSALLILPANSSLMLNRPFSQTLLWSIIFANLSVLIGIMCSLSFDTPPGPTIIIIQGMIFCIILFLKNVVRN